MMAAPEISSMRARGQPHDQVQSVRSWPRTTGAPAGQARDDNAPVLRASV